jgi:hypothetical protein
VADRRKAGETEGCGDDNALHVLANTDLHANPFVSTAADARVRNVELFAATEQLVRRFLRSAHHRRSFVLSAWLWVS